MHELTKYITCIKQNLLELIIVKMSGWDSMPLGYNLEIILDRKPSQWYVSCHEIFT